MFQHLASKEKVKNIEVKIMRKGYINDALTSVDFCETSKIGGKVIQICVAFYIEETLKYTI